jgi:hypothetical protein
MGHRLLAASRVRTFRTRQVADPPEFVRTFGAVVDAGPGPLDFGVAEAIEHAHPSPPPGCARGKVAAFSRRSGRVHAVCWQVSDDRAEAHVVGCCNAAAAVAAVCADAADGERVRMRLSVPGPDRVRVEAVASLAASGARVVRQAWSGVPALRPEVRRVLGRPCAVVVGPFNDYLVLAADGEEALAAFSGDDARRAWGEVGGDGTPLRARVAVVAAAPACGPPRARFFTCGGRAHPSAPLTGLAVVALAARRLPWLGLAGAAAVRTEAGPMPLPRVTAEPGGTSRVEFPGVVVDLLGPPERP